MELYSEHFISNTNQECKVPSKKYRATCDKKNIYNILSNLETDISKIKYRVIREKTKSAEYDFDKMYLWYKNKLKEESDNKVKSKQAAAAYANKMNSQLENDTKEYEKKNRGAFEKKAQKQINSVKPVKLG